MTGSAAGSLEAPPVSADGRASYVLVADADIIRSSSIIESLGTMRMGALVARDGLEAMEILQHFGLPSLLIISLSLPRRDPFAVITALRSVAGPDRTAIIALASIAGVHRISPEARGNLGISSVLPCTIGAATLRAAIEKAVDETVTKAPASALVTAPQVPRDIVGEILRDVTSRATRLAGAAGSVVYLEINGLERFRAYVDWISDHADVETAFSVPYVFEWISKTGDVLVVPDLNAQPTLDRQTDTLRSVVRGLIAVPLVGEKNRVIGALCVFDVKPLTVTPPQLEELRALGRDFGSVLENQSSQSGASAVGARSQAVGGAPVAETSTIDAVTGLVADSSGRAVVVHQAARAGERQQPISLILIAPDHAEGLEPALGSDFKDRVLSVLGQTVRVMLRASDVVVRSGPAEILVVLPEVGVSTARDVAERIREAARKNRANDLPSFTLSGGVTEVPPGANPEEGVRRVRERLVVARKRGGNRIY